jgi:cell division protein FtsQ
MTKAGNITISILMWCAIAAYMVAATHYGREKRADITVGALRIAIADTTGAITGEKVADLLAREGIDPIGRRVDSVDVRSIERLVASRPEVRRASVWTDLSGTMTVRVEPRTPIMRVSTAGGYRFWYTDDHYIMPDRGEFTAYVPVVTGTIPFPFSPSASGRYTQMQADNSPDVLERFTALDDQRRELAARYAATRSEMRTVRADGPKRWWGKARREDFAIAKAARLAELGGQLAQIEASISKVDGLGRELREKEKKSYQSHRFLSKLANFVEFIAHDRFWSAQTVQINVVGSGGGNGREGGNGNGGGREWREPQLEIVPRAGDHTILVGELDGTETGRLENLRLFYDRAMWYEGWDEYRYINIKYGNQIVCTK